MMNDPVSWRIPNYSQETLIHFDDIPISLDPLEGM